MRVSRKIGSAIGVFMIAAAVPAAAQTPAAPASSPAATKFSIGVLAGASSVQNVGGLAGAQITYNVTDHVRVAAEGVWMQDLVSCARLAAIAGFATYLGNAQGKAATATLDVPTTSGNVELQYVFGSSNLHPYLAVGGGIAHMVTRPTFTLAGADVTTSLATYGITLGSDLSGSVDKLSINGGFGVLIDRNKWTIDLGARVNSIQTDGQKTNAARAHIGLAFKF